MMAWLSYNLRDSSNNRSMMIMVRRSKINRIKVLEKLLHLDTVQLQKNLKTMTTKLYQHWLSNNRLISKILMKRMAVVLVVVQSLTKMSHSSIETSLQLWKLLLTHCCHIMVNFAVQKYSIEDGNLGKKVFLNSFKKCQLCFKKEAKII